MRKFVKYILFALVCLCGLCFVSPSQQVAQEFSQPTDEKLVINNSQEIALQNIFQTLFETTCSSAQVLHVEQCKNNFQPAKIKISQKQTPEYTRACLYVKNIREPSPKLLRQYYVYTIRHIII